jgi:hypothetical protein
VGFTSVEFNVADQVLIINSESIRYPRKKNKNAMEQYTKYLWTFKKAYNSVRREL